jgi:hypothetical protein
MAMVPHIGVVYDRATLTPRRIIDPGLDHHPTLGMVPASKPRYEALIDGTHGLSPGEAMAIIQKSQVAGKSLIEIAKAAILLKTGRHPPDLGLK